MKDLNKDRNDGPPIPEDRELGALLESWVAPDVPRSLDARVMAAYREQFSHRRMPLWKRILTSSIHVPIPVAAAIAVLMIGAVWVAAKSAGSVTVVMSPPQTDQTRIIELPVVHEKIVSQKQYVTRVVYRDGAADVKARLAPATNGQPAPKLLQIAGDDSTYFTRARLAGFEAPQELKIKVIRGGDENEK
ncbi:MAG TPA: hypothetical protein VFD58_32435 [Blastocatellia bacterium]|nr:hypothetical protein [Blastocatellia bacterium]